MTTPPARPGAGWLNVVTVVLLLGLVIGAVAAIGLTVARPGTIPEPALSQQLNGAPPLANLVQDQGNSVALPDGRTLWVFADTAQLTSSPRFFVTSSAALAQGRSLDLTYLTGPGGAPIEFLPRTPAERASQVPQEHYTAVWPTGATTLPDGRILIAYAKYDVRLKPSPNYVFLGGGLYEYRLQDQLQNLPARRLADNLWSQLDGPVASPLYHRGQVYFLRCENYTCYALRTTPAALTDRASYQWWTGTGWSPRQDERAPLSFGSDVPGRNPSIGWSQDLGLFTMADTTGGIQSSSGRFWVAHHPQGPWSRAASFPLPQCPDQGCYTLNVHPDQSAPGTLRVSFATLGLGPYVRVVDVPVVTDSASDVPSIRTG
jgi:hypothetical protein